MIKVKNKPLSRVCSLLGKSPEDKVSMTVRLRPNSTYTGPFLASLKCALKH